MKKIRCSLKYHYIKLDSIPTFAGGVRDGIYNNPTVFNTPPMLQADFQAFISEYQSKRDAYKQGGLAQKAPFLNAKENLMVAMDDMAEYVDSVALGNANTIILSGFVPTKGTASDQPDPVQPTGLQVKQGSTGILYAECDKQDQAIGYGCIMTVGQPLPDNVVMNEVGQLIVSESGNVGGEGNTAISASDGMVQGTFDLNPNRKKKFVNLTPGVTYYFVFYAYNAQGVSPLSASASLMCV